MNPIRIFDTTLRDGEQSPGCSMNIHEKVQMAIQLEKLGVDIIEAGFPIASPDDYKSVEEISKKVTKSEICGLARALPGDIMTAHKALKKAKKPRIHTFLALSDIHLKYKLNISRKEALKKSVEAVELAKSLCKRVDFSPEDATRSDPKYMCSVLTEVIKAGADTLNIPDTVGYSTPNEFEELIRYILKHVKGIDKVHLAVHCHNDLGLAVANSLAAIKAGANQVECTINGIGERAGNAALEEVVMAIKTKKEFFGSTTRIKTKEIIRTSKLLTKITGVSVQPNKAIVGANAFAHEAGIHQHGILKKRLTYEILKPEDIGLETNKLVLGKHSGKHAMKHRLKNLGYKLSKEELSQIFKRFKDLADKKKEVFDEDLDAIMNDEYTIAGETILFEDVEVLCGTLTKPKATVILRINNKKRKAGSMGTGPVDAAYKAVDKMIKQPNELLEFTLNAVTEGIDALAEVMVRIKEEKTGRIYTGRSAHSDIVVAAIKSYINALNKIIDCSPMDSRESRK